jgi:predicted acyltransferase (DUF342 family)
MINILTDKSRLSQNASLGVALPSGIESCVIELPLDRLDDASSLISNLKGEVLNLLSPETFSLYRAKLYQMLSANKNVIPFDGFLSGQEVAIARWSFIGENAKISADAKVGLSTYIGPNVVIGANSKIGNFCWLGEGVVIAPGAVIGNNVTIHDGVRISTASRVDKFNEIRRDVVANKNLSIKSIETDFYGSTAYIHNA